MGNTKDKVDLDEMFNTLFYAVLMEELNRVSAAKRQATIVKMIEDLQEDKEDKNV